MGHNKLVLRPGVDQIKTPVLNEAAISTSQLIRFMPDRNGLGVPQKLGGWTPFVSNFQSNSTIRALLAWEDTNSIKHLAFGAESNLYMSSGAAPTTARSIAPQKYTISRLVDFSTTSGSSTVIIGDIDSYITGLDAVYIATQVSVGGLILYGLYACTFNSADVYEITAVDKLGDPLAATATVTNSGTVPVFDSTSGAASVEVTLADHGLLVGDTFPVFVTTEVGGLTLYGNYLVGSVIDADTFTITGPNTATTTATVNMNDGEVEFIYYIGNGILPVSTGYGVGGYGAGGYGSGVSISSGRVLDINGSGISGDGTNVTIVVDEAVNMMPGSQITVSGVTPTGYNANYVVTSVVEGASTTTIVAAGTATGAMTIAGIVTVTLWGPQSQDDWSLDNYGSDLIANPYSSTVIYNDGVFILDPTTGNTCVSIIPTAPPVNHGILVAMPQRQIVAWGSTFTGIHDPLLIRWSDVNNPYAWLANVTNQAGSFRISKGSKIVTVLQSPQQMYVWTDLGVWAMQYVSQPYIYQFNEIGNGCGLIGRKAMGVMDTVTYWMGQSQFYRLAGQGVEPVQCPVWDVIFQDLDTDNVDQIRCAPNSRFGEIAWYYPTTDSAGVPSKYVKYNIQLNEWDFGTLERTAWINQSVYGPPIGADDTVLYQHETSTDAAGQALSASFTTGYFALDEGNNKVFVDEVWPDFKWGYYGGVQSATVQMTFYGADFPGQTPVQYGPYSFTSASTFITTRIRARLLSIEISSDDVGSFWRLGGVRYRSAPDGRYG